MSTIASSYGECANETCDVKLRIANFDALGSYIWSVSVMERSTRNSGLYLLLKVFILLSKSVRNNF